MSLPINPDIALLQRQLISREDASTWDASVKKERGHPATASWFKIGTPNWRINQVIRRIALTQNIPADELSTVTGLLSRAKTVLKEPNDKIDSVWMRFWNTCIAPLIKAPRLELSPQKDLAIRLMDDAITNNKISLFEDLIKENPEVKNHVDSDGNTFLMKLLKSATSNADRFYPALNECKELLTIANKAGETPIQRISDSKNPILINHLIQRIRLTDEQKTEFLIYTIGEVKDAKLQERWGEFKSQFRQRALTISFFKYYTQETTKHKNEKKTEISPDTDPELYIAQNLLLRVTPDKRFDLALDSKPPNVELFKALYRYYGEITVDVIEKLAYSEKSPEMLKILNFALENSELDVDDSPVRRYCMNLIEPHGVLDRLVDVEILEILLQNLNLTTEQKKALIKTNIQELQANQTQYPRLTTSFPERIQELNTLLAKMEAENPVEKKAPD